MIENSHKRTISAGSKPTKIISNISSSSSNMSSIQKSQNSHVKRLQRSWNNSSIFSLSEELRRKSKKNEQNKESQTIFNSQKKHSFRPKTKIDTEKSFNETPAFPDLPL